MLFSKVINMVLLFCLLNMVQSLTIRDVSKSKEDELVAATASMITDGNYRKSMANIKETPFRVPEHLQFVPKGFVYEDADDVIHVIDPPKHFEELKKFMQRQQQLQSQNRRPVALREQRPKPKIIKTLLQAKQHKGEPPKQIIPATELIDMQTQEAQHLPLEILASVRKTENYLRKYKPKLPSAKQRLKTQKIQTVIWEQQQEQQQYQQGQEQRLQGIREQTTNRRHFNIKRYKRDTSNGPHKNLKGEQLLTHLNELINNASSYLKQAEPFEEYSDSDFEVTTLRGEILTKKPKPTEHNNNELNEDMVVKILENSVKATNVIMQQLATQTNLTSINEKCDFLKVTYPNHIQNLQHQIKCMQNFIKDIGSVRQQDQKRHLQQLESAQKLAKKYEQRVESRKTKHLKHKPFIAAQLAEDYTDDTDAEPTPVNSSLIYDDVMTTIRNMLQIQNLQKLDDADGGVQAATWEDSLNESLVAQDKSTEAVNFHNLNEYLTSLETIVTNLPKFNHKSLNLQEIEGGSASKYYFINPQGTIYSLPQPFQKDAPTSAPTTIFHQFPDLPIIKEYLRNGTLLPPSTKVIEIL